MVQLANKSRVLRSNFAALALVLAAGTAAAQTPVSAPDNKFKPSDDVRLGREAAAQVEQQMPILRSEAVDSFVDQVGQRLVRAIPSEFRQPEFRYSFGVVNARDMNAFALPGGPMYVNRGMIAAARTEGEIAGVMAHELSHVVLRHGTAQASKAQNYQLGQLAGQVIGAIVGGTAGSVIAQGSQFGLGAAFLRFSRDYERQADILGSQIMARAGYDPMDMASMFATIEEQGGQRGPEWLSSHPDPGNRKALIEKEASMLRVENPISGGTRLRSVQARLEDLPRAATTAEIMRNAERGRPTEGAVGTSGSISDNVEPPAREFRRYTVGDVFQVSVPENWRQVATGNSVRFAPEGAMGTVQGKGVFTHGVEFGVAGNDSPDLGEATQALIQAFQRTNPELRLQSQPQRVDFGGRAGLQVRLRNSSEVTGRQEEVVVNTALLEDNNLFYSVGVAPSAEFGTYSRAIQQVNRSVQLVR